MAGLNHHMDQKAASAYEQAVCGHGAETNTDSFTWSARGHLVANEN